MGTAIIDLFNSLIWLVQLVVLIWAVTSWLIAFDVINTRNPTVYRIVRVLDAICSPMMAPIRRFIPNLGGVDISPIIFLLLLKFLQTAVNLSLRGPLIQVLG